MPKQYESIIHADCLCPQCGHRWGYNGDKAVFRKLKCPRCHPETWKAAPVIVQKIAEGQYRYHSTVYDDLAELLTEIINTKDPDVIELWGFE